MSSTVNALSLIKGFFHQRSVFLGVSRCTPRTDFSGFIYNTSTNNHWRKIAQKNFSYENLQNDWTITVIKKNQHTNNGTLTEQLIWSQNRHDFLYN